MADNSGAEKSSSPLHEIVRKRHALWWAGGAVVLIALVVWGTLLASGRVDLPVAREWILSHSDWFVLLGFVASAILALAIFWKVPQWQVGHVRRLDAKARFDRVNEARKTLATILGGIALLAGGVLHVAEHRTGASQPVDRGGIPE